MLDERIYLPPREQAVLANACAQADTNAALEERLSEEGVTVRGAAGQWRLNASVTELRQGRLALARLLDQVCLDHTRAPDEEDEFEALLNGAPPWPGAEE